MQGRCPKCNRAYEISEEFVAMGGKVKCPHCLQDLVFQKDLPGSRRDKRYWEPTKPDPNRRPATARPAVLRSDELEARCPACSRRYRVKKSFLEAGGQARCLHCDAPLEFPGFAEPTKISPQKVASQQVQPSISVEQPPQVGSSIGEPASPSTGFEQEEARTLEYRRLETARIRLPELDEYFAKKEFQVSETEEEQLPDEAIEGKETPEADKFDIEKEQAAVGEGRQQEEMIDSHAEALLGQQTGAEQQEAALDKVSGSKEPKWEEEPASQLEEGQEGTVQESISDLEETSTTAEKDEFFPLQKEGETFPAQEEELFPSQEELDEETQLDTELAEEGLDEGWEGPTGPKAEEETQAEADQPREEDWAASVEDKESPPDMDQESPAVSGKETAPFESLLADSESYPEAGRAEHLEETLEEEQISDGKTEKLAVPQELLPGPSEEETSGGDASEAVSSAAEDWARQAEEWAKSGFDPAKMPSFVVQRNIPQEPPSKVELPQEIAQVGGPVVAKSEELLEVSDSDIVEPAEPSPQPAVSSSKAATPAVEIQVPPTTAAPSEGKKVSRPLRFSSPVFLVAVGLVLLGVFAAVWWMLSHEDLNSYSFPPPPPTVKSMESPAPSSYRTCWEAMEHYGLGNRYAHQGRFEDAIVEYKQAARIDPNFPLPHRALGAIYALLGNRALSLLSYETYVNLDPAAPDAVIIKEKIIKKP